jgi:hypothetical protein
MQCTQATDVEVKDIEGCEAVSSADLDKQATCAREYTKPYIVGSSHYFSAKIDFLRIALLLRKSTLARKVL